MTAILLGLIFAGLLVAVVWGAVDTGRELAAHRSWEAHVADALAIGSRSRHPSARGPR